MVLSAGTYTLATTLTMGGTVTLIGSSSTKPVITRATQGPIMTIAQGDVTLESLRLTGAKGATLPFGNGISCPNTPPGARHVHLVGVDVEQNASIGVSANNCTVDAVRSTFVSNGGDGISLVDGGGTIQRSVAASNGGDGISADGGVYVVRNVFSYRNANTGIDVTGNPGSAIEFCTVVDNGFGITCGNAAGGFAFPNNISVRNTAGNTETGCTYPGSIIGSANGLLFKSSETTPYDYHLGLGSVAIDAATLSPLEIDFDGDKRPTGNGRDVGADEFVP